MDGYAPPASYLLCFPEDSLASFTAILLLTPSPAEIQSEHLGLIGADVSQQLGTFCNSHTPTALLLLNTGPYPSWVGLKELSQVFLTWSHILVQVPALPIVPPHHYSSVCLPGHRGFKGPAQLLHKMSHTGCAIAAFCLIHFKGMLCSYTQQST